MKEVPAQQFEELVADALDRLPDGIISMLDNVVVQIEDRHPEEDLLGLYEGLPLTEREDYGHFDLPDRITLYRLALCDFCTDMDHLVDEVLITTVHEVAHHFGIDDERLHELGWG